MPFVVCESQGGPLADDAFAAGVYFGEACAVLHLLQVGIVWDRIVPTVLVPQLDLLAMSKEVQMDRKDLGSGWSWVRIPGVEDGPREYLD